MRKPYHISVFPRNLVSISSGGQKFRGQLVAATCLHRKLVLDYEHDEFQHCLEELSQNAAVRAGEILDEDEMFQFD